jgi:histidine phosphotransferase ChpT
MPPDQTIAPVNLAPGPLDPISLAGMVAARMCHDLAGSLGALTGTLELAVEDRDEEALRLALTLAQEVAGRLRLLRGAWGSSTDLPDWESLVAGLPGGDRLHVETARLDLSDNRLRQLALSLILVAGASLPRGGTIRATGTDKRIVVELDGQRAAWPETLARCVVEEVALLDACDSPRDLPVALVCLQARACGRSLTLETPTRLSAA